MFNNLYYIRSPSWVQELMIAVREGVQLALRENGRFERVLSEINRTQWLDLEALSSLQESRLVAIVQHAVRHVPYYRDLFRREGWDADDFRCIKDLQLLPIITKQDIVANPSAFVAEGFRRLRFRAFTSGSTGTPLTLYQDLEAIIREHAFVRRHLLWAGWQRGQRRAWIRGDMIVPVQQRQPPFWRLNRPANMLMLSSYHLSETNARSYIAALESYDPVVIQAYPSSISFLANVLESFSRRYEGRSLKGIVTSSETLTAKQKTVVEFRFRCRVFDQYGSAEKVIMAGTCEAGKQHLELDYGFAEYFDCTDGSAELVGTGFYNRVMPLLRYKIGDKIIMKKQPETCSCGRRLPIVDRIEGRLDDYLITLDGRRVARLAHVFEGASNVVEAQIIQSRVGEIRVRVVPTEKFSPSDRARIIRNVSDRLGDDTQIHIELVASIPRGPNGKFRAVVRCLQPDDAIVPTPVNFGT